MLWTGTLSKGKSIQVSDITKYSIIGVIVSMATADANASLAIAPIVLSRTDALQNGGLVYSMSGGLRIIGIRINIDTSTGQVIYSDGSYVSMANINGTAIPSLTEGRNIYGIVGLV